MEREGEQIEGHEDGCEGYLAVPEIVLKMIAAGFEYVERFVLDLPSGPPARGEFRHVARRDCQVGDEAIVIGPLALRIQDFDGEPVDVQRVLRAAQGHRGEPAIDRCRALAADDSGLAVLLKFGAIEIFGDGRMRGRFACEDEVATRLLDGGGDRLAGEQVIPEKYPRKVGQRRVMPRGPAFRGVALAILLLRSILGRDELGWQRQDLFVARGHDAGPQEGVKVFRAAIRTAPRPATRAMDLA